MLIFLLVALAALAAGAVYQAITAARDRRRILPPGRLVDAAGRRLHLHVTGEGGPTVVLEAGLGASSVSWCLVQPGLAEFTRVCAYDRAGLGWSEAGPGPRTAENFVEELRAGLHAAGLSGPFVLVSHSAGAFTVQLFAARYPQDVAGLVLVDPVDAADFCPPSESRRRRMRGGVKLCRRCRWLAHLGLVRLFLTLVLRTGAAWLAELGFFLGSGRIVRGGERLASALRQLPAGVGETLRALWSPPGFFRALAAQIEGLEQSARQVRQRAPRPELPVTVISAGQAGGPPMEAHRKLADSFSRGRHEIAEASDHFILLDQPGRIVTAVRKMVDEIRAEDGPG